MISLFRLGNRTVEGSKFGLATVRSAGIFMLGNDHLQFPAKFAADNAGNHLRRAGVVKQPDTTLGQRNGKGQRFVGQGMGIM